MVLDPVAFSLGPLDVYWYGIVYALGFLLFLFVLRSVHKTLNLSKDEVDNMVIITAVVGLISARIVHMVFYDPIYYLTNLGEVIRVDRGGMSAHGGILGGVVALYFYSRKKKINFFKIIDIAVIPLALILTFGRIANFVNQELVGTITDSRFGVVFPDYDDELRWPSQLIESIKTMFVFQVLLFMYFFKKLKPGIISAWFLILYNGLRFIVNFVREPEVSIGIISMGQLLSLFGFILGLVLLFYINKYKK